MCMQLIVKNRLIKPVIIICPPAAGFKSGNRTRQNIGPIRGNNSGGRPNCWGPGGGKGARLYAPPLLACQSTVAWADLSHSSISNSNYSISNLSGIALPTHPPPFSPSVLSFENPRVIVTYSFHVSPIIFVILARSRSYLKKEKFLEFFKNPLNS
jgi:hypothetical protein